MVKTVPNKVRTEPIGESILSRREMTEEAIIRVYKKIESQFKTNH